MNLSVTGGADSALSAVTLASLYASLVGEGILREVLGSYEMIEPWHDCVQLCLLSLEPCHCGFVKFHP